MTHQQGRGRKRLAPFLFKGKRQGSALSAAFFLCKSDTLYIGGGLRYLLCGERSNKIWRVSRGEKGASKIGHFCGISHDFNRLPGWRKRQTRQT